jgi:hypothetical protein
MGGVVLGFHRSSHLDGNMVVYRNPDRGGNHLLLQGESGGLLE